ncbi:MAG: hypothetical protein ABR538_00310 [Candidatus Binatia bacterium]
MMHPTATASAQAHPSGFPVVACPPAWRTAAALLRIVARGSLLVTAGLFVFSDFPPANPFRQMRIFFGFVALPELAAWCIARAFAARIRAEGGGLVVDGRDVRVEIPATAIAAVEPWVLPLPGAGIQVRLHSGRSFSYGIRLSDADDLVRDVVAEGADPAVGEGLRSRIAAYARGLAGIAPSRFDHPLFKFLVYAIVPTVPAYRLHQIITYGGFLGEYYTFGLKAWLLGFGLWWVSWAFSLMLVAAVMRVAGEALAMLLVAAAPGRAGAERRWIERILRVLYFAGIPLFLLVRLLDW